VILGASAYCLRQQVENNLELDGIVIGVLVLAAFFGLFCFLMTMTSLRYIFSNMTNIDMLKKPLAHQLAVRVPPETQATEKFITVTYPLLREPPQEDGAAAFPSARDQQATRKFAILRTEPGENPWHLGYRKNWQQIMGNNLIDFLLPITRSPCTLHADPESEYPVGPLIAKLRARYGLTGGADGSDGTRLEETRPST
jgi:palmitoyltransferase